MVVRLHEDDFKTRGGSMVSIIYLTLFIINRKFSPLESRVFVHIITKNIVVSLRLLLKCRYIILKLSYVSYVLRAIIPQYYDLMPDGRDSDG